MNRFDRSKGMIELTKPKVSSSPYSLTNLLSCRDPAVAVLHAFKNAGSKYKNAGSKYYKSYEPASNVSSDECWKRKLQQTAANVISLSSETVSNSFSDPFKGFRRD